MSGYTLNPELELLPAVFPSSTAIASDELKKDSQDLNNN
jgi:hypothetical protein